MLDFQYILGRMRLKRELLEVGETDAEILSRSLQADCGTGAGGFKPGNTCAAGGRETSDSMKTLKNLGGSTGALLKQDSNGNKWVVKKGNSEAHIESEHLADNLYAAMGAPVAKATMETGEDGRQTKVAEFISGTPLGELEPDAKEAASAELRKHFVADAIVANWDVIGMEEDNVLVTPDGVPMRIDNGGSLKFRAQGAPKDFGPVAGEIDTLRSSNQGRSVFGPITDAEIAAQVDAIDAIKYTVLAVADKHPAIRSALKSRIENLVARYKDTPR